MEDRPVIVGESIPEESMAVEKEEVILTDSLYRIQIPTQERETRERSSDSHEGSLRGMDGLLGVKKTLPMNFSHEIDDNDEFDTTLEATMDDEDDPSFYTPEEATSIVPEASFMEEDNAGDYIFESSFESRVVEDADLGDVETRDVYHVKSTADGDARTD